MLIIKEKIILTGKTVIDGVDVCGYQAQIDSEDPANIAFTNWKTNNEMYKEHRGECRADLAAFEDRAFEVQDKMLNKSTVNDETTTTEE
jgi:hypothetical protein